MAQSNPMPQRNALRCSHPQCLVHRLGCRLEANWLRGAVLHFRYQLGWMWAEDWDPWLWRRHPVSASWPRQQHNPGPCVGFCVGLFLRRHNRFTFLSLVALHPLPDGVVGWMWVIGNEFGKDFDFVQGQCVQGQCVQGQTSRFCEVNAV